MRLAPLVLTAAAAVLTALVPPAAVAQDAPEPQASATPRPLGFRAALRASLTFVDQAASGPGVVPPEAPGFIAGAPLAPNTPYDLFSSAPQTPGIAGIAQLVTTLTYATPRYDAQAVVGAGYVRGSATTAAYWGENLLPTLNPHLGAQALPYGIVFPTHPGVDDAGALRVSVLAGALGTDDGALRLRAGWFDLAQTNRFVFAQPALTSVNPAIAYAPAESLAPALPGADRWLPDATALPLHGVDLVAHRGGATLELAHAALPSLPGEDARMSEASIVLDRGEGTRYSAQVLHAWTSGTSFTTTVPFGADPAFVPSPQGVLPVSTLSGQRQTNAGLSAAFHLVPRSGIDGIVELGRSWYDAAPAARPGTARPGGFYHAGVSWRRARATASIDLYRMEPRYATMILPYGVPENQWSVAFAWPGQWLKSNYQLIDNSVLGVNRQGYRLRYALDRGPVQAHLEYTDLRQIDPETYQTATQTGFIDGYYLPQAENAATFGRQKRMAGWFAVHPRFADITLDVVDDLLSRPFFPAHTEDRVAYEVPQAVLTVARRVSPAVTAAAGYGRYGLQGAFAQQIDLAERLAFAGAIVRSSPRASTLVTLRRSATSGISAFPAAPRSPAFTASAIVVEQRYRW